MPKIDTCRVCLQTESTKCVSLFDNYKEDVVSEHIKSIAAVEIDADDELPQGICPECLLQLDNALEFKRKCLLSDQILRNGALKQEVETSEEHAEVDINVYKEEEEINVNNPIETIKEENESMCDGNVSDHTEYLDTEDVTEDIEVVEKKSKAIDLKLICDDCGGSFKSKCKLKVHWKKMHLTEKLTCQLCKRIFKSYKPFNAHKKKRPRSCLIISKLKIEGEGRKRVFHCTYCSYKSKDFRIVDAHLPIHTGEKKFQCNICGKCFTQFSSLAGHKEGVHKNYKYHITCHLCGKQISGRTKANRHMQRHKAKDSQCKICNKVLKSEVYLAQHMIRHSGVKAFTCEICGKDFYTNHERITHRRIKHAKNHKYKCEKCGFKTSIHKALVKHTSKHTDTNVPCLICGNFFDNAEKFAKHKKLHDENKYNCQLCPKKYATRDSLGAHVKQKHKGLEGEKTKLVAVTEPKQECVETE